MRILRLTKARGGLDDCLEAPVAAATATRLMTLKNVARRGLVFERFLSSRVRACTSSNSRTFSIAITAWSAKVCKSSICLSVRAGLHCAVIVMTPIATPSRSRGTPRIVRNPPVL